MKFLNNLNLNKNQIQNALMHPLAVAPSSPKEGQMYYNTNDKMLYYYNGTAWIGLNDIDLSEYAKKTDIGNGTLTIQKNGADVAPTFSANQASDVKINIELTKADVGLNKVENLSPSELPVSTAQQTALDAKLDKVTDGSMLPQAYVKNDDGTQGMADYIPGVFYFNYSGVLNLDDFSDATITEGWNPSLVGMYYCVSPCILSIGQLTGSIFGNTTIWGVNLSSVRTDDLSSVYFQGIANKSTETGYEYYNVVVQVDASGMILYATAQKIENAGNKVTAITGTGNDTNYPTTKAVADYVTSKEPYHVELTGASGTFSDEQYNKLKADYNSYILFSPTDVSTQKTKFYRQETDGSTLTYCSEYLLDSASIIIQADKTWRIVNAIAEDQSNKTDTLSASSTIKQYPSAKAVFDYTTGKFAPINHASSATTYGVGTSANYGHVKLVTGDMNGKANVDGQVPSLNHTHGQYATIANPSFTGNVTIGGNLTVDGTTTTIESSTLQVKDKLIEVAVGNTTKLTSPAGLVVPKYDGTNSGALVFDGDGIAYVGDVVLNANGDIDVTQSDLQALAARAKNIVNGNIVKWDATTQTFIDTGIAASNLATVDDIPTNYVTTNTAQTISGVKTFTGNVILSNTLQAGTSVGTSGQVLTSQGAGKAPQWTTLNIPQGTVKKLTSTITGDGTKTSFNITNTLSTTDCTVSIYSQTSGVWEMVMTDVTVSSSAITIIFAQAPTSGQSFRVVVTG